MTRIAVVIVALAPAVLAVGCSSGGGDTPTPQPSSSTVTTVVTTPPPTVTSTPAPSASGTPASSTPASGTPTTKAPVTSLRACTNAQLTVSHHTLPGAASHSGVVVVFRNTSSATCDVFGYPGAAVVDAGGKQFEQAARTVKGFLGGAGGPPRDVVLRPAASASARIEGDNGGGDACLRGVAFLVTPPNTEQSSRVPFKDYSCHVQVHPTVAGTEGGGPA